jgi:hypothetical protein
MENEPSTDCTVVTPDGSEDDVSATGLSDESTGDDDEGATDDTTSGDTDSTDDSKGMQANEEGVRRLDPPYAPPETSESTSTDGSVVASDCSSGGCTSNQLDAAPDQKETSTDDPKTGCTGDASEDGTDMANFPWCEELAQKCLGNGKFSHLNVPTNGEGLSIRRRYGASLADVERDPAHSVLCEQIDGMCNFFSSHINAGRESSAFHTSTIKKITGTILLIVPFAAKRHPHGTKLRVELLLDPRMLRAWVYECLWTRNLAFSTLGSYLTTYLQIFNALRGLGLSEMDSDEATGLHNSIWTVRRQLTKKSSDARGSARMVAAERMHAIIKAGDPEAMARMPGPLKYGLAIEHASDHAADFISVLETFTDADWEEARQLGDLSSDVAALARGAVATLMRLMQVGVDAPPLRPSMIMSLNMPHKFGCQDPNCASPSCGGNQVAISARASDGLSFRLPHHKSVGASSGGSGAIVVRPPAGSMVDRLTRLVVYKVLPFLYDGMDTRSLPEGVPLPMFPDVWHDSTSSKPPFRAFADQSAYAHSFKRFCLGSGSVAPEPIRGQSAAPPIERFKLVHSPFLPGEYTPGDCRKHFVTTVVHQQSHIADLLASTSRGAVISELKRISARHIGNKNGPLWDNHYDLYFSITESRVTAALMGALKKLLSGVVRDSGLLKAKRGGRISSALPPAKHPRRE